MSKPAFSTLATHLGRRVDETIATVNLPVYRASTVLFDSLAAASRAGHGASAGVGARHASSYGTAGTATTFALMDALAELEGAGANCRAALMPSGLAAISTALLAFPETAAAHRPWRSPGSCSVCSVSPARRHRRRLILSRSAASLSRRRLYRASTRSLRSRRTSSRSRRP